MPQYLPFNETSKIKIFDNQVAGDFSAVTIGTDLFSLGMERAIEDYTINNFSMTLTNEAGGTPGAGTLDLRLETSSSGVGSAGWTQIAVVTNSAPTAAAFTQVITAGMYVRIRPVSFRTDEQSFHILVEGERTV